ncbi:Uncharacterised protein [Mycobacteroides abscessus]|nr:Uncharacterised protein [Mycobacteroides abscessus]SKV11596.1 Uncharacterised protein [Mycobacteroides abscessus subsp. abscessus]
MCRVVRAPRTVVEEEILVVVVQRGDGAQDQEDRHQGDEGDDEYARSRGQSGKDAVAGAGNRLGGLGGWLMVALVAHGLWLLLEDRSVKIGRTGYPHGIDAAGLAAH